MYLEKLEILGFKSFANKNVLLFPGMLDQSRRGITAVVGPNGSCKSNVADAVRWALGEQSMKTLRGKKSEDIIFSGSDKKGKLGMAEVSLFLNNEDRKAPIDFSEVVLTRRLYRNGDSEYMINNNRVRLSDIQMLLAKASFGQKTYSVIGQGMVEGFLNTTLAERKEFFDEATGVRQYQIKRDESLNKLRGSYENLTQAGMLITEIEPRLKSLTRQVSRLQKRGEAETELRALQIEYYGRVWHDINDKFSDYNNRFLELEKIKLGKEKKLSGLNHDLEKMKEEGGTGSEYSALESDLNREQLAKEGINRKLARLDAQMEMKLEAGGQFDLSFLVSKKGELKNEIGAIGKEIVSLKNAMSPDSARGTELTAEKAGIDREIDRLNALMAEVGKSAESTGRFRGDDRLRGILEKIGRIEAETDLDAVKKLIAEIKNEISAILDGANSEKNGEKKEKHFAEIHESLNVLAQKKEEILKRINENNLRVSARAERVKLLEEKNRGLESETAAVENKIKQASGNIDFRETENEKTGLEEELASVEDRIRIIKEKIAALSAAEEENRRRLFSLQKNLQELQNEINLMNNQLNEHKINSTRYETRLESLEIEIREELGGMEKIKNFRSSLSEGEVFGLEAAHEKIKQLKRQLELIGGVDPQGGGEYKKTKERYDFLSGQGNDLTGAIDSLQKIIKELDITIKEKFDKEFKLIAEKFQEYFKILFNGGQAKIVKVIEEEEKDEAPAAGNEGEEGKEKDNKDAFTDKTAADLKKIKFLQKHNATGLAGIEIQATPPGKKIQTVTMLSGGERALTAIALICAIISANPSPFVVLDEVDAALDEANSERLARILDDLSHKTQFIVITHNRASMRRANILYGITMGDDGVSKLLSIKLEDAGKVVEKFGAR